MKSRLHLVWVLLAALVAVTLPRPAWADESAEAFLKNRQTELNGLLKQGKSAAVDQKVEKAFDAMLDYETLAKQSLDEHWASLSEAERVEFQGVLKQLVRNAYRRNLRRTLDYDVEFKGESKAKAGILVRTVAKSRSNAREEPISIDYLLHKVGPGWRVFDIVTEGSSLVNNYRSQFNRVIKKKGFAELMRRMKGKLDKDAA
jgi:phospholipid transport system substrate-binding protein